MLLKIVLVVVWIIFATSFLGYLTLLLVFGRERADILLFGERKNERRNK